VAFQMAAVPVALSDLEGHLLCETILTLVPPEM